MYTVNTVNIIKLYITQHNTSDQHNNNYNRLYMQTQTHTLTARKIVMSNVFCFILL